VWTLPRCSSGSPMMRLAFKNLLHEPVRLLISTGGVAAALFLVLLLEGVFEGTSQQLVTYLEKSDADVWVMQKGVSNMHMATSVLPMRVQESLAAMPEVQSATPILYASLPVQIQDRRWLSYVVGVRPGEKRGGPWAMAEGATSPKPGEAVVSNVMAKKAGVGLGDSVHILSREVKVVGLSQETFSMANSITFVSYSDMEDILATPAAASYFLVKARPGVLPDVLSERVRQAVPGVNAMTREQFVASDRTMAQQMGTDLISVMTAIGYMVGVAIIGLTIYTATVSRAREYGVVKALGTRNSQLMALVALQALAISVLGSLVATALAYLTSPMLKVLVPEIPLVYSMASLIRLVLIAIAIAALASLLPAYRVARVEPAIVFKE